MREFECDQTSSIQKDDEQHHNSVYTQTVASSRENINENKFSRFKARNTRNSEPPIIISNQQQPTIESLV